MWREKADAKYGPPATSISQQNAQAEHELNSASEKAPSSDNRLNSHDSEREHEHEHKDEPGHLRSMPVGGGRRATLTGGTLNGGTRLTRQNSTKGEMPPVQEVLKRTVSLSSASVHGG